MMVPKLQTLSDGNITIAFTAFNDTYHTPTHELNTITKNVSEKYSSQIEST